ncbi:DUF4339 domain-containing protein [bacterium]|jgi:hypothetical protein|nr:DUF4339 domain-containing protein [bacterium]
MSKSARLIDTSVTHWFLDIRGTRTGPFTVAEIQEHFKHGRITEQTRATCNELGEEWTTVGELVQARSPSTPVLQQTAPQSVQVQQPVQQAAPKPVQVQQPVQQTTPKPVVPFTPPPRPAGIMKPSGTEPEKKIVAAPAGDDVDLKLLDTLKAAQAAKKKTAPAPAKPEVFVERRSVGGHLERIYEKNPNLYILATATLVISTMVFAFVQRLGKSPEPTTNPTVSVQQATSPITTKPITPAGAAPATTVAAPAPVPTAAPTVIQRGPATNGNVPPSAPPNIVRPRNPVTTQTQRFPDRRDGRTDSRDSRDDRDRDDREREAREERERDERDRDRDHDPRDERNNVDHDRFRDRRDSRDGSGREEDPRFRNAQGDNAAPAYEP